MGKSSLVVLLLMIGFSAHAQQASEPATAVSSVNHSSELIEPMANKCPGIETVTSQDDPDLIYNRVVRCVDLEEFDRAAELMFVAMSFGKFDSMRVSGRVRHHAVARSRIKAMNRLDALQLDSLHKSLVLKFHDQTQRQQLCSTMRQIGRPSYQPRYMLEYENPLSSLQTHLEVPSSEIPAFEQELAWESVFFSFAQCPV